MTLRGSRVLIVGSLLLLAIAFILLQEWTGLRSVGETAPDFSAVVSSGERVTLSRFRGKNNVVLFFYPKDFTPGCTAEACSFRDEMNQVRSLGAVVLGISRDDEQSHQAFASRFELPFDLIADRRGEVAGAYGTARFWNLLPYMKRVTYVIDRTGIIRGVFHHEFSARRHIADVVRTLKKLQSGTTGGVQ